MTKKRKAILINNHRRNLKRGLTFTANDPQFRTHFEKKYDVIIKGILRDA